MAKKILVADDEEFILDLVSERLKENGYEVITASDGYRTVELAREQRPHLIILDVKMPCGGGNAAYDSLKNMAETARIPIIFFTAYLTDDVVQKIRDGGARDYVAKPFKMEEILAKVRAVIGV